MNKFYRFIDEYGGSLLGIFTATYIIISIVVIIITIASVITTIQNTWTEKLTSDYQKGIITREEYVQIKYGWEPKNNAK